MHEFHSPEHDSTQTLETIEPPKDSFEVLENTFAVASNLDGHRYLHTEDLSDCKAVTIRNGTTKTTVMAHLSCVADLDEAIQTWASAVVQDEDDPREVTITTGSNYDPENDHTTPSYDDPALSYYSLSAIETSITSALAGKGIVSMRRNVRKTDDPRGVAINLHTGELLEVDPMAGDGERADTSKNHVIESSIGREGFHMGIPQR